MVVFSIGDEVIYFQSPTYPDERGCFSVGFNKECFAKQFGIQPEFVQQNISFSYNLVARGLHYQEINPQGKLVSCFQGDVIDIILDIRPESTTYGKFEFFLLNSPDVFLWIPPGFAHGFIAYTGPAGLQYFVTDKWNPKGERGINLMDTLFSLPSKYKINSYDGCGKDVKSYEFLLNDSNISKYLTLSEKDAQLPSIWEIK